MPSKERKKLEKESVRKRRAREPGTAQATTAADSPSGAAVGVVQPGGQRLGVSLMTPNSLGLSTGPSVPFAATAQSGSLASSTGLYVPLAARAQSGSLDSSTGPSVPLATRAQSGTLALSTGAVVPLATRAQSKTPKGGRRVGQSSKKRGTPQGFKRKRCNDDELDKISENSSSNVVEQTPSQVLMPPPPLPQYAELVESAERRVNRQAAQRIQEEQNDRFARQLYPADASISDRAQLGTYEVESLETNPTLWMDNASIFALLMYIVRVSQVHASTVVISPAHTENIHLNYVDDPSPTDTAYNFTPQWEQAIIPIRPNLSHWTWERHNRGTYIVHYYESIMANPDLSSIVQARVRSAVSALNSDIPDYDSSRIQIVRMPRSELNQQTDGYNCGFHVVLAAESHLMNQSTRLKNLNLAVERTRLIILLRGLLGGNIPPYVARPISGPLEQDAPVATQTVSNAPHLSQTAVSTEPILITGNQFDRELPHVNDIPWEYQPHPEAAYQKPTVANFDDYDCDVSDEISGFIGSQTITTEPGSQLVLRLRPTSVDTPATAMVSPIISRQSARETASVPVTPAPTHRPRRSWTARNPVHNLIRRSKNCRRRHVPFDCGDLRAQHKVEYFDCGDPGAGPLTSESLPEHKGKDCPYCAALRFRSETYAKCCADGKVKLRIF